MCWETRNEFGEVKPHKAMRDNPCYKVVYNYAIEYGGDGKIVGVKSMYRGYAYRPGELNRRIALDPVKQDGLYYTHRIDEGYHSYSSLISAVRHLCPGCSIIRCIIPKGCEFYQNEYGELVSENIIVTDIKEN